MHKILPILLILFSSQPILGQVFSDSTSNFYVGLSIGQAQHNITNNLGTFGRSHIQPRIYGEFGYTIKNKYLAKVFATPSIGFSYQQLSLQPIPDTDESYNDRLSLMYLHLNWLVHLGAEKFMVYLGPSLQVPLHAKFEIHSKTSDGAYRWVSIHNEVTDRHPVVGLKIGSKIKFGFFQLGLTYSLAFKYYGMTKSSNPYKVNQVVFQSLDFILYLPLKL